MIDEGPGDNGSHTVYEHVRNIVWRLIVSEREAIPSEFRDLTDAIEQLQAEADSLKPHSLVS
ncbi:hypothetical protein JKG68_15645 [Microvirga aerilata]|jgi:hypothetical protein|uniref:Uncharacterized protein n=1 Tax=Microvirga aerilata TaxID=670292 RepID=A0A936ZE03_9HYPH|nr:hypothetical protein [Microvirga aerilata]MBL0405402.1 hypothetical protein [Microvirga aerilata]